VLLEGHARQAAFAGRQGQRSDRRVEGGGGQPGQRLRGLRTRGAHGAAQPVGKRGAGCARAFELEVDPFDQEALDAPPDRRVVAEIHVVHPRAMQAAEVRVIAHVRLVPDRLGPAERAQQTQPSELGERGVDRAAAEIGERVTATVVDLVGGEVLGPSAGEGREDGPALRRDPHPARAQRGGDVVIGQRHAGIVYHVGPIGKRLQDIVLPNRETA
jgi:hypothetical protein